MDTATKNGRYVHPVHHVNDGLITSYKGLKIDLNNPKPTMITDEDLAQGLANTCRFGGQMDGFYSVAQHSVLVMMLAPKGLALPALLHDAPEAYIGDVVKPLKVMLGEAYAIIEHKFEVAISKRYGVSSLDLIEIKQYDKKALELEYAYIHGLSDQLEKVFADIPEGTNHVGDPAIYWTPKKAANVWLKYLKMFS